VSTESEAALREIIARLQGVEERMAETRADAREARDAALRLTERVGAQDTPAKLAELRGDLEKGFQAARADLVNAVDKLTREVRSDFANHDDRIKSLEDFRQRIEGAGGLVGWLGKNAPWLLTITFAGMAALGFKEKLP
jgi:chromosome segregation ATPase